MLVRTRGRPEDRPERPTDPGPGLRFHGLEA